MLLLVISEFRQSGALASALLQLQQLPVSWGELKVQQLGSGYTLQAYCEAPVDSQALQESVAQLLPDVQVQVQDTALEFCSYIATLMAPKLNLQQLQIVLAKLQQLGLQLLESRQLSRAGAEGRQAWQIKLSGEVAIKDARKQLLALADTLAVDICLQPRAGYGAQAGLICFDMDSTLIKAECIDELARAAGIGDKVSAITAAAMRGEIDFIESFSQRMALLNGLPETVLAGIAQSLQFMDGAQVLINTLKARGFRTAILSGGFVYFAEYVKEKLGIDEIHANALEIVDGKVTGRVTGLVVDGTRKAELIQKLARERGLSMAQVIAVGDGANDLPMLGLAGLGVAIHAKPLVRESANYAISSLGLDGLCYLLGLEDADFVE